MTAPGADPARRARRLALPQTALVSAAFAMQLVASNALNPLLPVYRAQLDLSALVLSLTFVLYVVVLVVVLVLLARPRFAHHAPALLLLSLVALVASDLFVVQPEPWSILVSRALLGLAGGLGTGAASALVVGAIGAAGRSVTATGNLVGAVFGSAGAQAIVSLLGEAAPPIVFLSHAAMVAALFVALAVVLGARGAANARALTHQPAVLELAAPEPVRLGGRRARLLYTGSVAWIGVSVGVVFSATVFAELGQPLVQAVGPTALLVASAGGQLASPWLLRVAPWMSGALLIAAGSAAIGVGALVAAGAVAVVGFALLGAGTGIAYRAALIAFTLGASSARQGALASTYAAVTYTVAAATVLLVGQLGDLIGLGPAAIGTFAALAALALVALLWAPRLRDTVEPG